MVFGWVFGRFWVEYGRFVGSSWAELGKIAVRIRQIAMSRAEI